MAAMMTAAPVCIRASASASPSTRKARAVSSRIVAPASLRRSAISAGRRANSLVVSVREKHRRITSRARALSVAYSRGEAMTTPCSIAEVSNPRTPPTTT